MDNPQLDIDFKQVFNEELTVASSELSKNLYGYHVVFIAYKDEGILRPFKDNIAALKDVGFPKVSLVYTWFFEDYEKSAELLIGDLKRVYLKGENWPLIVIGNPGTSPETLLAVMKNRDLLELIFKVVLLQPAFGTPVVDRAKNSSKIARLLIYLARFYLNGNYHKFLTLPVRQIFERSVARLSEDHRNILNEKVFYVRSYTEGKRVTPWLALAYWLLRPEGENDSISYTRDQKIEGIGRDLTEPIQADHWDLNVSFPFSNSSAKYRKAFTRALLKTLVH